MWLSLVHRSDHERFEYVRWGTSSYCPASASGRKQTFGLSLNPGFLTAAFGKTADIQNPDLSGGISITGVGSI